MEKEVIKKEFIEKVEEIIKDKTGQDIEYNRYFETCSDTKQIIPVLQEINDLFLTTYKLKIEYKDKTITILPVETEIYFSSNNFSDDTMIHNNDRQKGHFGQLYFHRIVAESSMGWGKNYTDPIDLQSGGVDVCLSQGDYYLSVLIRSAYINKIEKENLVSGINKICKEIIKNIRNGNECIECLLREKLEKINVINPRTEEGTKKINTDHIFHQPRISGEKYSSKDYSENERKHKFLLNSLNKGKDNEILKDIIKSGQTFYKNKQIKDFEEKKETLY